MNKLLALILLLSCTLWVYPYPIDKKAAYKLASTFMQSKRVVMNNRLPSMTRNLKAQKEAVAYYIFNAGDDHGFVVVAGDDAVSPIIGYADKGSFLPDSIPSDLQALLNSYSEEMTLLRSHPSLAAPVYRHKAINPLLSTLWNQSAPYNMYCPTVANETEQSVTGCVATAMAQVMYYHQWPQDATQEIPAYSYAYDQNTTVDIEAAPSTTFDWDAMRTQYGSETESDAAKAVGKLMYWVGRSVKMQYTSYGSGASSTLIPIALKRYFNYDDSTRLIVRSEHSSSEWDQIIYNELFLNRPVIISATSVSGDAENGHCFVCDGCDANGLYHINWGWGGYSNGYFRLSLLNPDGEGIGGIEGGGGYSLNQDAVVGIQPQKGSSMQADNRLTLSSFGTTASSVTKGNSGFRIPVSWSYSKTNDYDGKYDVRVGAYDASNNLKASKQFTYSTIMSGYIYNGPATNFYFKDLADGTYTIKMECSTDGTHYQTMRNGDIYFVTMTVSGTKATFAANGISITCSDMKVDGSLKAKESQTVTASIQNTGSGYTAELYLFAGSTRIGGSGVNIVPGESTDISFSWTPNSSGSYVLKVCSDADGKNILAKTNVTINAPASYSLSAIFPETDGKLSTNVLSGNITIKNDSTNDFSGNISIYLTYISGEYLAFLDRTTLRVDLAGGSSVTIPFSFSNLQTGMEYVLVVSYISNGSDQYITDKISYTVENTTGINRVRQSSSSSTPIYNLQGVRMPEGKLPAGVYIRDGKKFVVR
jgi:hypothetical protein